MIPFEYMSTPEAMKEFSKSLPLLYYWMFLALHILCCVPILCHTCTKHPHCRLNHQMKIRDIFSFITEN